VNSLDLETPGHFYIGKDGKERYLVSRGEYNSDGLFVEKLGGMEFCWQKSPGGKIFHCWVSTWRGWVKKRVK
jgi:hypothetical protein